MLKEANLAEFGDAISDALGVLRQIAQSPTESGEVRVQAARAILEFAADLLSLSEDDTEEDFEEA